MGGQSGPLPETQRGRICKSGSASRPWNQVRRGVDETVGKRGGRGDPGLTLKEVGRIQMPRRHAGDGKRWPPGSWRTDWRRPESPGGKEEKRAGRFTTACSSDAGNPAKSGPSLNACGPKTVSACDQGYLGGESQSRPLRPASGAEVGRPGWNS